MRIWTGGKVNMEQILSPRILAQLYKVISNYWQAIEDKRQDMLDNPEEYENCEEDSQPEDYVNVWMYYKECKDVCGINTSWLKQECYHGYMDIITDGLNC